MGHKSGVFVIVIQGRIGVWWTLWGSFVWGRLACFRLVRCTSSRLYSMFIWGPTRCGWFRSLAIGRLLTWKSPWKDPWSDRGLPARSGRFSDTSCASELFGWFFRRSPCWTRWRILLSICRSRPRCWSLPGPESRRLHWCCAWFARRCKGWACVGFVIIGCFCLIWI